MSQEKQQMDLRRKPERRSGPGLTWVFLALGGVLILAVISIVAWQVFSTQHQPPSTSGASKQGGPGPKKPDSGNITPPWAKYPAIYWQTLRTQIAQDFHMSEQQLRDRLAPEVNATATAMSNAGKGAQPAPGKPLSDLAVQLGITTDQLHAFEVSAVQKGHDAMVHQGVITQQQATQGVADVLNVDQDTLNWHMIDAFVNH